MPPMTDVPIAMRLLAPAPVEMRQRQHAEDEGEARHQDRAKPDSRRLQRRVDDAHALPLASLGELDHQDRVLGREAHRREQADLQVDVVLEAPQRDREHRPDQPERNDQQHGHGNRPALVQRGQAEEDDEQRDCVEQGRLPGRQPLLIGLAGPGDAGAVDLRRKALHLVHRFARADARRRLALEFEGGHALEARQAARRGRPARLREGRERRHLAVGRADVPLPEACRVRAVRRVGLHIDALDPALVDEVVDVAPAPGRRQSAVDVILVEAERGQLLLVDVDLVGGDVGQVADADGRQLRICIGFLQQAIARGEELLAAHAAAVLELHGEAARLAKAADRAGDEREDLRVAEVAERARGALDDRVRRVLLAGPLVPRHEVDEALAGVLTHGAAAAAAAGDGETGSAHSSPHAR